MKTLTWKQGASSSSKGINDDLAKFIGLGSNKDKKEEQEKKNASGRRKARSVRSPQSTHSTLEKQLMKFKAEISKEENLLEAVLLDAKALEPTEKAAVTKAAKQELNQLPQQKAELSTLLKKKALKVEPVKVGLQDALAALTSAKKVRAKCQKALKDS